MNQLQQRKRPILSLTILIGIGIFFGIRVFSTASNEQKSDVWETESLQNLSADFSTSKIGIIKDDPEITVYAEVNGKIKSIAFETGEEVKWGQPIITISDEGELYKTQLELSQSELQNTQELYEKLQENYSKQYLELTQEKDTLQQQLKILEQGLANDFLNNQKEEQIQQQINTTNQQITLIINQRIGYLNNIEEFLIKDEQQNTEIEINSIQNKKLELQQLQQQLTNNSREIARENLKKLLTSPDQRNNNINEENNEKNFLIQYLNTQILNWLEYVTNQQELLKTLEQKDRNAEKQQKIQQQEYNIYKTEKELEDKKLAIKLLENNHNSQIEILENSLQSLRNEYEQIYNQYNKLSVRAPIAGKINKIFIEVDENIYEWHPLFTIQKPIENTEIEVQLTLEEYLSVLEIEEVKIKGKNSQGDWSTFIGKIILRSPIANEEGMYTLSIESSEKLDTTFPNVEIDFPIDSDFSFLPKSLISIKNQTEGYLHILSAGEFEKLPIELWKERNNYREIKETLISSLQIITKLEI